MSTPLALSGQTISSVFVSYTCVHLSSLDMEPLAGVVITDNSDVTQPDTWEKVLEVLRGHQVDVVMRWVMDAAFRVGCV